MDGKAHAHRLIGTLAAALAAMLLAIPAADAGRRNSQPHQDGWYQTVLFDGKARVAGHDADGWFYNVLHLGTATRSAAGNGSSCRTNRTYQHAVRAGELPAIVAALHGGGPVTNGSGLNC
jgi:hypothetical protein